MAVLIYELKLLPFSRRDLQAATGPSPDFNELNRSHSPANYGPLPKLVTDPAFNDILEKRYFQFFRQKTSQSTSTLISSKFWDRVVLQASHVEPAVKHAVLALSALHQLSESYAQGQVQQKHIDFVSQQHIKALQACRNLVATAGKDDIDRVLIVCIIMISFEGIRGDYAASQMHMSSGRTILVENKERLLHNRRRNDLAEIVQALSRLDVPALTFRDASSSNEFGIDDYYSTEPKCLVPSTFESIAEAHACFTDLLRLMLVAVAPFNDVIDKYPGPELDRCDVEMTKCSQQMQIWRVRFEDLLDRKHEPGRSMPVAVLRAWHLGATIILGAGISGPERRFDAFISQFDTMIGHAEIIVEELLKSNEASSFSVEMGYCDPVFFCASRCRDPSIRRRAIAVLKRLPRQEGIWQSTGAAVIAERWVQVEEEGLSHVECADDIPEHNRITLIMTAVNVDQQSGRMKLTLSNADDLDRTPVTRDEYVTWQKHKSLKDLVNCGYQHLDEDPRMQHPSRTPRRRPR